MEIKQLTFTRFVAAFIIILFHYGQKAIPFESGALNHFAREGAFSVSYFFCLSGYILTHVYYINDNSLISKKYFFAKRFARIYPIYFFSFIIALISGIFLYNAIPKGYSILLQLFGLHAWFPGICLEINFPAWSISAELLFYLCFTFLINLFRKLSSRNISFFTMSIWLLSAIIHILLIKQSNGNSSNWTEFIIFNPIFHINAFIFGMAACIIFKRNGNNLKGNTFSTTIVLTSTCLLLFLIISTDNFILPWGHNGLFAPLFVVIIISLQLNNNSISRIFSSRPLVFLGEISFGLYILQHPVRIWFEEATKNIIMTKSMLFYSYLFSLILITSFVYIFIEKPARKWLTDKFINLDEV